LDVGRVKCQRPKYVPREHEVRALAEAAPDEAMWAFTLVAGFSGLRLHEVAGLDVEDFDPCGRLTVRRGKGGYENEVSLLYEPGLCALEDVIAGRTSGQIFSTPRGHRWDRRFVWRLWGPMVATVGVPAACTFHALRHFHSCWLVERGGAPIDVAAQMRHHDNGELVRKLYARHRAFGASLDRLDGLR
jgi:integrase